MRMTIESLTLENFKGIRALTVTFGSTTRISGMNGTGKTTIPDAFAWLLWNKDSHGNASGTDAFHEKPLGDDGKEVHNLDTAVEAICTLDGTPFTLKRTQRESWVKKRGAADATFQGNVSTYWINGVETKLADFKARIAAITSTNARLTASSGDAGTLGEPAVRTSLVACGDPEDVFRLIGSLGAFNALDWKKRRAQLVTLSGADVDGTLLASAEYRPIADEAAQRGITVDDLRKVLLDSRKRTAEALRMIPVRIDEATRALQDYGKTERGDAYYSAHEAADDIARVETQIAECRAESATGASRQQMLALESEIISLKRRVLDDHESGKKALERAADAASDAFRVATATEADARRRAEVQRAEQTRATRARDALREAFIQARRDSSVVDASRETCPTCGQPLPPEAVKAAAQKALEAFTARLADIRERGTKAAEAVTAANAAVAEADDALVAQQIKKTFALAARDEAFAALKAYPATPDYASEPRIAQVSQQLAELRTRDATAPDEKIAALQERKRDLQAILDRNNAILARCDAAEATRARIKSLEAEQRETGERVTALERQIDLIEQFIQARCGMLETSINDRFPTVRWKLFDTQINGGITDCCVCMIPCGSGLITYECANTAAQINADLEIINTLSDHYDLRLPVFVDNAERVNVLAPTTSQLITLAVSSDATLTIKKEA